MKKFILIILSFVFFENADAQNIGINTTGATGDASALLDVSAPNKGILVPRVTLQSLTDNTTISSPATSLLVYSSGGLITDGYYYNSGTPGSPVWSNFFTSSNNGGCFNNWQLFTANGTFTVTAGVTLIKIAVWGGGSGGGNDGGFGGGGGGYAEGVYTVVPATVYQITIGAGGAGGGNNGGQSCFSTGAACTGSILISATGGIFPDGGMGSGGYLNATLGSGGSPGEVGISSGSNGENGGGSGGKSTATYAGGGGGGGVGGGRGGTGGGGVGSSTAALANTGAGGGGANAASTARTGKAGAAGKVIVFW